MFNQESDLDTMVHGITRLRNLLRDTDFGARRGVEFAPGEDITGQHLKTYIRNHAGTAYHPVGTLRLGGPITSKLRVKNTERLWVADASIMPQVTSANTNAPSMMIGWQGAKFIASEVA
jgi:choline dehydrogenase-like flavoprotein